MPDEIALPVATIEAKDGWFYVHDAEGKLQSETSRIDDIVKLPEGWTAVQRPTRADGKTEVWDEATRDFVARPPVEKTPRETTAEALLAVDPAQWTAAETNQALALILRAFKGQVR